MGIGETRMKIAVVGLWHLGLVTAACLTKANHQVLAYDPDAQLIENLKENVTPISEPGLDDLLKTSYEAKQLTYTHNPADIREAEIIWVNFDTPVDENDHADVAFVINEFAKIAPYIQPNALVLFSSQLPVGSTRKIQQDFNFKFSTKHVHFGYIPENLRLGKAIQVFTQPDRFVVGLEDSHDQTKIIALLGAFTENFVWMSIESAEMTKHALNAFLALSVTFINEIATLCEGVGADAREVEAGLKTEERIGTKAYLRPGSAIAGGTLLRDIQYLEKIGSKQNHPVPLITAVNKSNTHHKDWVHRKITEKLLSLKDKTVAVLGLTYKVNTNTLRRSSAVETCNWLHQQGVKVNAYDPAINILPSDYANFIQLKSSIQEALITADAIVIATEWPDFRNLEPALLLENNKQPLVLDPSGFLMNTLGNDSRIRYCSVGRMV